jgi:plastocyanin
LGCRADPTGGTPAEAVAVGAMSKAIATTSSAQRRDLAVGWSLIMTVVSRVWLGRYEKYAPRRKARVMAEGPLAIGKGPSLGSGACSAVLVSSIGDLRLCRREPSVRTVVRMFRPYVRFASLSLAVVTGIALLPACGEDEPAVAPTLVSMTDYAFAPNPIVIPAGGGRLTIVNAGELPHDFVVPELGKGTIDVAPGAQTALDLSEFQGTFVVICSLPGHREAGMETTISIP